MKEVTTGAMPEKKKKPKIAWKAIAGAGIGVLLLLSTICAMTMQKSVLEREVKVRYDGQTYIGQNASGYYDGYNSYYDSYGWGITNSVKGDSVNTIAGSASMDSMAPEMAPSYSESANDGYADYDIEDIYDSEGIAAGKKLVYTYDYNVETTQFDSFIRELTSGMEQIGAYPERMSTDRREYDTLDGLSSNSVRRATYTLRVPADRMQEFKALLGSDDCEITYENARMSDRTQAYADAELQVQSYKAEYARLEALIEQAESVTELIAIQDRLQSLNYSIQWQEKQKDWIDEDVAMSEVSLTVYEVLYYTSSVEKYRYRIGERIADAFADFVLHMPEFLFGLVYLFLGGLVVILLGRILAAVVLNLRNKKARDQVVRLVSDDGKKDT